MDRDNGHDGYSEMDVLVTLDGAPVPGRIAASSRRRVNVPFGPIAPETVADLRAHIPRSVGLIAPDSDEGRGWLKTVAQQLHQAGLPIEVLSDVPMDVDPAIEVRPISDPGPTIQAADSLLDLIGNTPLVRLDPNWA